LTPYFTIRHRLPIRSERFVLTSRFLIAQPQPRRGFHGRIEGPGFVIDNHSKANGKGRHIPDGFTGLGFTVESAEHGWSIDLGASLWLLLVEDGVHEGIDPPLLLRFTHPLG
jgi:hypothetical protein